MARALVNVPKTARRGEIITIKVLVQHVMETGYRHRAAGRPIPRDIITSFVARYGSEIIFEADFFPAMAANPFLTFTTTATESGRIELEWTGDNGFHLLETVEIAVT